MPIKYSALIIALGLLLWGPVASAANLSINLVSDQNNPSSPQMGDRLTFHSTISNTGASPINRIIAWISLIQIDPGNEQPVDLEDWSAHKAVVAQKLAAGQTIRTDWPMRLIQSGHYRIVVSAVSRDVPGLTASPFINFFVRQKPVVESGRVLPVALGLPVLLALAMAWRIRQGGKNA